MSTTDDLRAAQAQCAEVQKEVEKLRAECESLRARLKNKEAVAALLLTDVRRLDARCGEAQAERTRAETTIETFRQRAEDAQLAHDAATRELDRVRGLNGQLAKKCADFGVTV